MDYCQKLYFPHADVTIDEQLFSYRSRLFHIFNKQFNIIVLRISRSI